MHTVGERASTSNPTPDTKRRDARSRPPPQKAPSTTHCSGDGTSSKPLAHLGSSGPIKATPPPWTKALYTLQGTKYIRVQMEQDMICLEELREQTEKDLSVACSLLLEYEEDESRLCEKHSKLCAASKATSAIGNSEEKRQ